MKLKQLHIFSSYTDAPLHGSIEFTLPKGEFKFTLEQRHIQGILTVIADSMVAATKEIANNLTADVIDQTRPLLTDICTEETSEAATK